MAASNTDVKFYHSLAADGGDIDVANEIISAELNAFVADVSASDSETGVVRRTKFYVKNNHATDALYVGTMALSAFSLGDDYFTIYHSSGNATVEGNEDFLRRYGIAQATGELNVKTIPIEFEDPNIYADIFKVGDEIAFFSEGSNNRLATATIDVVTSTELVILEDLTHIALEGAYIGSNNPVGTIAAQAYVGFWLEQTVLPLSGEQLSNSMNLTFFFDPTA